MSETEKNTVTDNSFQMLAAEFFTELQKFFDKSSRQLRESNWPFFYIKIQFIKILNL